MLPIKKLQLVEFNSTRCLRCNEQVTLDCSDPKESVCPKCGWGQIAALKHVKQLKRTRGIRLLAWIVGGALLLVLIPLLVFAWERSPERMNRAATRGIMKGLICSSIGLVPVLGIWVWSWWKSKRQGD